MDKHVIFQIIFGFVFFIISLVCLVINAKERAKVNDRPSDVINMGDLTASITSTLSNLRAAPVLNVRIVNSSENCYGSVPTLYTWSTVSEYCQCSNSVTPGTCSSESPCYNETGRTITMDYWKGKRICLNYLKENDWIYSRGGSFPCPDGFKLCKGGVCVNKTILECPLTDIRIATQAPTEGNFKNASAFFEGKWLFTSKDIDKPTLTTFLSSVGDTVPCINPRVNPRRLKGNNYPILVR
jgi:hypothetical protein